MNRKNVSQLFFNRPDKGENNFRTNISTQKAIDSVKTMKIADIFKNLYKTDTGGALKNLCTQNDLLKVISKGAKGMQYNSFKSTTMLKRNHSQDFITDNINHKLNNRNTMYENKNSELSQDPNIYSNNSFPTKNKTLQEISIGPNILITKKIARKSNNSLGIVDMNMNQLNDNDHNDHIGSLGDTNNLFMTKTDISNLTYKEREYLLKDIQEKAVKKYIENAGDKKLFCPYCSHCNVITDDKLEEYVYSIKESKNIITKAFDFIIHNGILKNPELSMFQFENEENVSKYYIVYL